MLGIRRPDRHLLPRITPSTMRGPRRVLPPARAGSFIRRNPAVGSSDLKGRNPHPSRPFAAVVAKGSFGWRRAEGFPPRLPVNLYNQKSHVLSAAMCAMSESR